LSAASIRLAVATSLAACPALGHDNGSHPPPTGKQRIILPMSADKTVRRLKTYAGTQGYVYQYYFVGQRPALQDDLAAPAVEFIFDVTSDRKLTYAVSVFLSQGAIEGWASIHGRALNDAEQYAAAKLRLFRAFDELEDVKAQGRRLLIDNALLE